MLILDMPSCSEHNSSENLEVVGFFGNSEELMSAMSATNHVAGFGSFLGLRKRGGTALRLPCGFSDQFTADIIMHQQGVGEAV
ncbi:hypothetical protein KY289_036749 [Solanum tuberosum]|nr:hypothetical protein KY289_036749 [Solanum tuberosum]